MTTGARFVQVGEYTIMVNAIKSIDPYYEQENRPYEPPKLIDEIEEKFDEYGKVYYKKITKNNPMWGKWKELYGSKLFDESLPDDKKRRAQELAKTLLKV